MSEAELPVSRAEFRAVADRVELTELLSRYHQTIDRNDFDALDRVFAEDARCAYLGLDLWGVDDVRLEGREKIIDWLRAGLGQFEDTNPNSSFGKILYVINYSGSTDHYIVPLNRSPNLDKRSKKSLEV